MCFFLTKCKNLLALARVLRWALLCVGVAVVCPSIQIAANGKIDLRKEGANVEKLETHKPVLRAENSKLYPV